MPNLNYNRGARKEQNICKKAREQGLIAIRSAGSHSPIDCVLIDKSSRVIKLIQCKPGNYAESAKQRLYEEFRHLSGTYIVVFEVV
jgi:Holliday junction resolvase